MKAKGLLTAYIGIIAAASAGAQTVPATSIAPPAAPPPVKKICREMMLTGSIIPGRRECRTRAEWASFDESTSDAFEKARNSKNRSWSQSQRTD